MEEYKLVLDDISSRKQIPFVKFEFFSGKILLFVVNHPSKNDFEQDSIEKFQYNADSNTVEHLKTYAGDYTTNV